MFEEEAFVLPDSFEEDEIDIFAELGVVNNRPVAAKSAQNQFFKSLSIEWARRFPKATITLLHPGTVDTDLSRPFHKFVPEHKLFSTEKSSQFLINIIKNQSPASTGKFIAWDSSEIPW